MGLRLDLCSQREPERESERGGEAKQLMRAMKYTART